MTGAVLIPVTNHRRQCGRFTTAGGANKNHQTALGHGQFFDDLRHMQLFDSGDFIFNQPHHHTHTVTLIKRADPETTRTFGINGVVTFLITLEGLFLLVIHGTEHQIARFLITERFLAQSRHATIDFEGRRPICGDKNIRCFVFDSRF